MDTPKRFIPCIFLKNGNAVADFRSDNLVSADPARLALTYSENGADEIIVYDLSDDDASHDKAMDVIREICERSEVPVIGAGNVKRLEDVKKLLYAGCKKACLNYSKNTNVELTKEVSDRFGKDKIIACVKNAPEISENEEQLLAFVSEIILINEHTIKQAMEVSKLPVIVTLPDVSLDKIIEILKAENISGLTGPAINENAAQMQDIKALCLENGVNICTVRARIAWEELKKNSDGMVPVVVQDHKTDEVLMVAYMTKEAYETTLKTGKMTYYSRSRDELWVKGETSGHFQYVKSLTADCDLDTLLAKVHQVGNACHTGSYSCFFNEIMKVEDEDAKSNPHKVLEEVFAIIKDRKENPKEGSYTNYLFDKGIDKILKKLGEEATEIVIAAKNPNANEVIYEMSDFLYHMMVLMAEKGVSWEEVTEELARR